MTDSMGITPERDHQLLKEFSMGAEPTIRKLLTTILEHEHELYVFLQADHSQFVSEVLNFDWEAGLMWIGTPYEKHLVANCGSNTSYIVVGFPDGVKIQFAGIGMEKGHYQGAEAIRISIPKTMVRLQRRNYFRVLADEELNLQVKLEIPGIEDTPSFVDLSLAGCGFIVQAPVDRFPRGTVFKDVRLTMPDGGGSMLVELEVRNIKPMIDCPDNIQLGCEMRPVERGSERRLQRFLLATERRQRTNSQAT
jgi:flagellar brake protein